MCPPFGLMAILATNELMGNWLSWCFLLNVIWIFCRFCHGWSPSLQQTLVTDQHLFDNGCRPWQGRYMLSKCQWRGWKWRIVFTQKITLLVLVAAVVIFSFDFCITYRPIVKNILMLSTCRTFIKIFDRKQITESIYIEIQFPKNVQLTF